VIRDLDTSGLPDLPQRARLAAVATEIWREPSAVALWIGGSLARGAGDRFSDVDLRVAVPLDAFDPDRVLASAPALSDTAVAHLRIPFGDDAVLHHLMLRDGEIYDLFVQTTERPPADEPRRVLACRDAAFGALLEVAGSEPAPTFPPADPDTIRQVIVGFWIGQQKHQKVLHRDLALLAWFGENLLRQDLIRLWYVLATGNDCGPLARMTIHTLSPVVRTVQQAVGAGSALALVGGPLGSEREIRDGAARLRDEVARVGRRLAERLGFDYPEDAEIAVRRSWDRFGTAD
jgi:hypothetical protein